MTQTSPLPESSLPQAGPLVDSFLDNCRVRNLSKETLRYYSDFLLKLAKAYPELPDTPEPLEQFIFHFQSSDSRRHGAFRAVRAFYNWIERRYSLPNTMKMVGAPKVRPTEKPALTMNELKQLLEYPHHPPIIRTLLYFLSDTGIRIGEAANLMSDDIFEDTVRVRGKTGERIIPISPEVRQMLVEQGEGKVFPGLSHWLSLQVRRAFKRAGLNGKAHDLRRTFATTWRGSDLSLKYIGGWRSWSMVEHYSRRPLEKAKVDHQRHSPIAMLNGKTTEYHESKEVTEPCESPPIVSDHSLDLIVNLAKELGTANEHIKELEDQAKLKLEYMPEASDRRLDLDGDLLNFIRNTTNIDSQGGMCLAEAKFLYHAAMHNICMSLARRQNGIMQQGRQHAIRYLVEHGYLHGRKGPGSRSEIKEILERESEKIIDLLHQIFQSTGLHHYSLAECYGKLCAPEAHPGFFKVFEDFDL